MDAFSWLSDTLSLSNMSSQLNGGRGGAQAGGVMLGTTRWTRFKDWVLGLPVSGGFIQSSDFLLP